MTPDREQLLTLLKKSAPATLRLHDIAQHFQLSEESSDYEQLRIILAELVEEKTVYRSTRRKYGVDSAPTANQETNKEQVASNKVNKQQSQQAAKNKQPNKQVTKPEAQRMVRGGSTATFEGLLKIDGYNGVVATDSEEFPYITIKRPNLGLGFNGDRVRVKLLALRKEGKVTGEVIEIVERAPTRFVGKLDSNEDFSFFIPDDDHIHLDFLVHPKRTMGARDGDKVVVELYRWDDPMKSPEASVVEILGRAGTASVEYSSVLREFKLLRDFPPAVEAEASKVGIPIAKAEIKRRLDLRTSTIITIDPLDAKDFDDALSFEELDNGNIQVGIHIADVSHYVRENSPLDREALKRGNSVYLVDGVVPMLPHTLSSDMCSLVPNQDRLAYSVLVEFSKRGVIKNYEIRETVIHSKRRFTYEEVQDVLDEKAEDPLKALLFKLNGFADVLRKKRFSTGGIDFETSEIRFLLDDDKQPIKAVVKRRTDATSLVEEYMLAANRVVGEHVKKLSTQYRLKATLPFMYRIHDQPDKDKLEMAFNMVRSLGVTIPSGREITSKDINAFLRQVHEHPAVTAINQVMLRSMAKAVYAEYNIGHYGLGFEYYSHFTSPIRRYPDLIVHRLLKEYALEKPASERVSEVLGKVAAASTHCSTTERSAVEAERASTKLTQSAMAHAHLGEEFNGTITGVTHFGLFILLDEICCEGLVRVTDLPSDYYYHNEREFSLVGRNSRRVFQLGKRVRARIVKVNVAKREIDFMYTGEPMDADALKARNQARLERSQLDEPMMDNGEKVSLGGILKAAQRNARKEQHKRTKKQEKKKSTKQNVRQEVKQSKSTGKPTTTATSHTKSPASKIKSTTTTTAAVKKK